MPTQEREVVIYFKKNTRIEPVHPTGPFLSGASVFWSCSPHPTGAGFIDPSNWTNLCVAGPSNWVYAARDGA